MTITITALETTPGVEDAYHVLISGNYTVQDLLDVFADLWERTDNNPHDPIFYLPEITADTNPPRGLMTRLPEIHRNNPAFHHPKSAAQLTIGMQTNRLTAAMDRIMAQVFVGTYEAKVSYAHTIEEALEEVRTIKANLQG